MPSRIDLVLEGGGIRGVALAGAYEALAGASIRPANVAGTSAGAIVAALIAAGYTAEELERIAVEQEFAALLDPVVPWLPTRPLRALAGIVRDWGIYKGDRFVAWLDRKLRDRGCACFGSCMGGIPDRGSQSRLRVVASDITMNRLFVFPDDLAGLGVDPETFPIADAVRASIGIPFVFRPYAVAAGGEVTRFVDGGLLSNFPVGLFDDPANAIRPTIGIRVSRGQERLVIRNLRGYVAAIVGTAVSALDARDVVKAADAVRTIQIDTGDTRVTDFAMPRERRRLLYHSGRWAAERFLENNGMHRKTTWPT